MAAIEWSGFWTYKAKHSDIDSVLKASYVPVSLFLVQGGAKRIIDLTSTDDLSLVSEFEQTRNFKNDSLYLSPTQNFEWLDLTEVAIYKLPISIAFFTNGNIGDTIIHQFQLFCKNANITEMPGKRWDSDARANVLVVNFALPETRLILIQSLSSKVSNSPEQDWRNRKPSNVAVVVELPGMSTMGVLLNGFMCQ